jgi:hypothetical protein
VPRENPTETAVYYRYLVHLPSPEFRRRRQDCCAVASARNRSSHERGQTYFCLLSSLPRYVQIPVTPREWRQTHGERDT